MLQRTKQVLLYFAKRFALNFTALLLVVISILLLMLALLMPFGMMLGDYFGVDQLYTILKNSIALANILGMPLVVANVLLAFTTWLSLVDVFTELRSNTTT